MKSQVVLSIFGSKCSYFAVGEAKRDDLARFKYLEIFKFTVILEVCTFPVKQQKQVPLQTLA